jgi:23S rRNA pseudouridine1911/1915/1917 synthase
MVKKINNTIAEPNVLHEDNHIIAVFKPAGVLIDDLAESVKLFLKKKYAKPGNVFLGMVHQLDRPVSGIVLFAKTSKGAARLSEQFREHETHKTYHAWVEGNIGGGHINKANNQAHKKTLRHYIVKDENRRKAFIYDREIAGSRYAELDYSIVGTNPGTTPRATLLEISLKTGRFHQIRAQLSYIGHPILGDVKYGAHKAFPDGHIALSATSISFMTTTDGKEVTLSIPIPKTP